MRKPRTILIGQTIELTDGLYKLVGYVNRPGSGGGSEVPRGW